MKAPATKISIILLIFLIVSCNAVKRVDDGEHLLTKNNIYLDSTRISTRQIYNQLYQEPNVKLPLVDIPLRLHIFNLAKAKPDSVFMAWVKKKPKKEKRMIRFYSKKQVERMGRGYVAFNKFLEKTGEAPTIVSEAKTQKSATRLKAWYWNHGWFNVETDYKIDRNKNKRAQIDYYVTPHQSYKIDSISRRITSKAADSLYEKNEADTKVLKGRQFKTEDFNTERQRLTSLFRNNGLYHFEEEYISFDADTIDTNHKANIELVISNRKITKKDSTYTVPFSVHTISEVNIFTDYTYDNRNHPITDTANFNNYNLYSFERMKFNPKAITDAVFINKGEVYRDNDRSLTYKRMNELQIFKYPNIQYMPDPRDSTDNNLIANVFLTPKPKFGVDFNFDVSRSNIQDFGMGFGGSLLIRNVFRGAEILEVSARGSIGSSKDAAGNQDQFFNISEIGGTVSLTFPKIAFPFNTERIIPKSASPFTSVSIGVSTQNNIGLDKQNVTSKYTYRWQPSIERTNKFNLLDLQYVRNLNTGNYFNVYRNSFDRLNEVAQNHIDQIDPTYFKDNDPSNDNPPDLIIPEGANSFIQDYRNNINFGLNRKERQDLQNVAERKNRLTEDNLILASSFRYIKNTRENIYDDEFTQFRFKLEAAGNTLALIGPLIGFKKNKRNNYDIFGVQFSQYLKGEVDFIKHWDLGHKNILAIKALGGIAIPYGNSKSIPFARSFFAGGSNDNRGWQAYDLGPGSTGGVNEFNEANMKLSFSTEYRFNLFGSLNSAFFIDVGNIWNVADNVTDEASRFSSFKDLEDLAVGSGFGFRYDLDFFVIRLDFGFKTYDPSNEAKKWFRDYNFGNVVFNVGINYPF